VYDSGLGVLTAEQMQTLLHVLPTISQTKVLQHLLSTLDLVVAHETNKELLFENGGIEILLKLLNQPSLSTPLKTTVLSTLLTLAFHDACCEAMITLHGIRTFFNVLGSVKDEATIEATTTLIVKLVNAKLTGSTSTVSEDLLDQNSISTLITLLTASNPRTRNCALELLSVIAQRDPRAKVVIGRHGGVESLVSLLSSLLSTGSGSSARELTPLTLTTFTLVLTTLTHLALHNPENLHSIVDCGAISLILDLLVAHCERATTTTTSTSSPNNATTETSLSVTVVVESVRALSRLSNPISFDSLSLTSNNNTTNNNNTKSSPTSVSNNTSSSSSAASSEPPHLLVVNVIASHTHVARLIMWLLEQLQTPVREEMRPLSTQLLSNLSSHPLCREHIFNSGEITTILQLLTSPSDTVQKAAAEYISLSLSLSLSLSVNVFKINNCDLTHIHTFSLSLDVNVIECWNKLHLM
jgi:hypothetical protein